MNKRDFLKLGGASLTGLAGLALSPNVLAAADATTANLATATGAKDKLAKLGQHGLIQPKLDLPPISDAERQQRIAKAQRLMAQQQLAAIVLEPGAAMEYFTGISWWRSERFVGVVIPAQGKPAVICPHFEEASIAELNSWITDTRLWQEHHDPFVLVKQMLKQRGFTKGQIGFESSVRYFIAAGIMSHLTEFSHLSAEPVTLGCRMFKSTHELQLMHKANEITLASYQRVFANLSSGMSQAELKQLMKATQQELGGSSAWAMALFNEASAYPHGTKQKQQLTKGSTILMDAGCAYHGYKSDISRTLFFGAPNKRQHQVWQLVRQGQRVAFAQAQLGNPAGSVDDAVRALYQQNGFGPDYALPGLSHRTGHGIGMQGHESVNFVKGEMTKLQPGMCFSNEPGIYLPGEFGVRLEDCLYMTTEGPRYFTLPPESPESPLGGVAAAPA